jgi:prepilin-type N-terminal cleavage/methylation domain-containing protein
MRGYTLIELLAVLTLMAVGASTLAPTARRLSDTASVAVAREEVVAGLSEARSRAMVAAGSSVTIISDPPELRIHESGTLRRSVDLGADGPLEVVLSGGHDSTQIRFDALGLGRFASETIVLRRGSATATLVISSYGRVRRR